MRGAHNRRRSGLETATSRRQGRQGGRAGPGAGDHPARRATGCWASCRSTGSVVTWRRAQMVLLSAQGMDVAEIAQVTFTSPTGSVACCTTCNLDGFDSLSRRYAGGRPPTFTLAQRRAIKHLALSRPRSTSWRFRPGRWPGWPSSWSPRGCRRSPATRPTGPAPRAGRVLMSRARCLRADSRVVAAGR